MLGFFWNALTLMAACAVLFGCVFLLAVSALDWWRAFRGEPTTNLSVWGELGTHGGEILVGVVGILTALRALGLSLLCVVTLGVLFSVGMGEARAYEFCGDRYCAQGGGYEKPRASVIDQTTRAGRKIAGNIQKRPNVEADRMVPATPERGKLRKGGRFTAHFCGLGMGNWCGGMNELRRRAGGVVYSHVSSAAAVEDAVRTKPARIDLTGHSMGCKAAFDAAVMLGQRGYRVHTVVCFDGPRHFGAMPEVPANVLRVISWRQGSPFQLGGAIICRGKTHAGICTERRGHTVIHEETVNLGHIAIAHDQFIRAQTVAALR